MICQLWEMSQHIPSSRKTSQDTSGNIFVENHSFPYVVWSQIVPFMLELLNKCLTVLKGGGKEGKMWSSSPVLSNWKQASANQERNATYCFGSPQQVGFSKLDDEEQYLAMATGIGLE